MENLNYIFGTIGVILVIFTQIFLPYTLLEKLIGKKNIDLLTNISSTILLMFLIVMICISVINKNNSVYFWGGAFALLMLPILKRLTENKNIK
jgi:ABC-type phosphate transport system permease subunit